MELIYIPRHDQIDWSLLLEVVVYADMRTTGRGPVKQYPLFPAVRPRTGMRRPIIGMQRPGPEICGHQGFSDKMCLADPRPLNVWEDNTDGHSGLLELMDKGMDVRRRLLRWRAIIVDN